MSRVYVPSSGPDSWRAFLADQIKHWRTGHSARTIARRHYRSIASLAEIWNV